MPTELSSLTVCVTCVWAGVDNAWEQKKVEARKILENAAESHTSGARFVSPPTLLLRYLSFNQRFHNGFNSFPSNILNLSYNRFTYHSEIFTFSLIF
jgi:hypothetical protein